MDWIDYREKLGIGFCDDEKYKYFRTKIFNVLNSIVNNESSRNIIDFDEYFSFCNLTGTHMKTDDGFYGRENYMVCCIDTIYTANSLEGFLAYYIAFTNSIKVEKTGPNSWARKRFANLAAKMLRESHIAFDMVQDGEEYFIFPKGAKELDDALVSAPLEWLAAYPEAHTAFVKALKAYSEATDTTASDVADKFRKALETFFQNFFGGGKSLENYKSDYGTYLKSQGVPSEISANLETLLKAYTSYMNSYAKHHDKASMNVLEYIMYQTGNIIRLLITLKQEESANAD